VIDLLCGVSRQELRRIVRNLCRAQKGNTYELFIRINNEDLALPSLSSVSSPDAEKRGEGMEENLNGSEVIPNNLFIIF